MITTSPAGLRHGLDMTTPYEKSEALLNSRMQRLSSKFNRIAIRYHLPRVHGCIWDRHCRWSMKGVVSCRLIHLYWGRHAFSVELPGHDPALSLTDRDGGKIEIPEKWQLRPILGYSRRAKDDYAKFRNDYLSRKET